MLHDLLFRIRGLFRRQALDSALEEELRFHLEQEARKLEAAGYSAVEAARCARIAFGGRDAVAEQCRDARGTRWLDEFARDVAYGLRTLRLNPAFTCVAILSLALGIGANTAMFQLLDAIRLRGLPVRAPHELQFVRAEGEGRSGNFTSRYSHVSYAQWEAIRAHQQAYASLAAISPRRINLAGGGEVRPAEGMLVSGSFFETLGVGAYRGRVFTAADDTAGCGAPPAVISHTFWQREYNGDPAAIGRQLSVDGHSFTIAGITPPGFFGVEVGRFYDVALPLCADAVLAGKENSQTVTRRDDYWLAVIGRLRRDWTAARAASHLGAISPEVFRASLPKDRTGADAKAYLSLKLEPQPAALGLSSLRASYEKALWLLAASAALVLLIACGNLANLLLARAAARTHEFNVRAALGASAARIVRQLLTESLLLAFGGAACGLAVAALVSRWLVSFLITNDEPVALATGIDWRVLAFSAATAMVTCLLFGLAPAIQAARVRASSTPTAERALTASRAHSTFRGALVALQVALSVVLIAGAFLFGRSLLNLFRTDLGFRPENVMVVSIDTRRLLYDTPRQQTVFRDVLDHIRSTPGIVNAAQSTIVPMSGWSSYTMVPYPGGRRVATLFSPVGGGYFATLGTPVLAGREFGPEDTAASTPVAIVNEAFARRVYGDANPLEQSFRSPFDDKSLVRVVGVVRNAKYQDLKEKAEPILYFCALQMPFGANYTRIVVRSTLAAGALTHALRHAIGAVSPSIDIEFLGLDTEIRESIVRERLLAALAAGFGVLAVILAAVGLYGVLAYSVAMRRREIGIRMALGAPRSRVVGMVLQQAALLLSIGVVVGTAITLAAAPAARSLLYGLEPNDPRTVAAAVGALAAVGLLAAYFPARRASRLDPLSALRQE